MTDSKALEDRIAHLEAELAKSKREIEFLNSDQHHESNSQPEQINRARNELEKTIPTNSALTTIPHFPLSTLHSLLLLSDSALPLGSFAFSSGLESLLAHHPKTPRQSTLRSFLLHSLSSIARLSLPYLLAAHKSPRDLLTIDNDLDAATPCTVARRASIAQGRALIANWERAFRASAENAATTTTTTTSGFGDANDRQGDGTDDVKRSSASASLATLSRELRVQAGDTLFETSAHLAPVFGVVARALGLEADLSAYAFLLNHTKAVLSAAVRANVLGPYQAQAVLSSEWLRAELGGHARAAGAVGMEDAGQVWVPGDLYVGRHELLYSRIFNS